MKPRGTETVELKAVAQDGTKKEIVAFANNNGGTVYEASATTAPYWASKTPTGAPCRSPTWCETP